MQTFELSVSNVAQKKADSKGICFFSYNEESILLFLFSNGGYFLVTDGLAHRMITEPSPDHSPN